MSYAKNLLVSTDSSILDIAISVGFSLSHFDHVFKNFYHITPSEAREQRSPLPKIKPV
jgi:transcriptional regulator GlxA family with amidase domain